MNMRDWKEMAIYYSSGSTHHIIVPDARAKVICHQYQSDSDQRRQGASYYVNVIPWASWEHLAEDLYEFGENSAIKVFKAQLPKPKGNRCDCVECVGAVCSDSVHSAL